MSLPTITIANKQYPEPSIDRMKRKQIKKLKPVMARVEAEDLDAIWDLVALMVPDLPAATLDDLDLGDCKKILTDSGVVKFNDGATDAEDTEGEGTGITAGESSALPNS